MLLKKIQLDGKWFNVLGYVSGEESGRFRAGWSLYICRRGRKTVFVPMDAGMQPFDVVFEPRKVKLGEVKLDEEILRKIEELRSK